MIKSIIAVVAAVVVSAAIILSVATGVKKMICSWQKAQAQVITAIEKQTEDGGAK